jgi:membrane-bound metal-dependent hydrolase YbcI (DUF457 family)
MASPIAHSFAGLWTFLWQRGHFKPQLPSHWCQYLRPLGVLILLANAPDLDLLLGNAMHRGFTHSVTAAILVSLALACVWRIAPGLWRSAFVYFTAYGSHLLVDFFTGTKIGWTNSGYGMPLFWPWHKNFSSPLILIFGVRHKDFAALFSLDNILSCTYEALTFGAITLAASVLWKRKLKSRISRKSKLKSRTNPPTPEISTHLRFDLPYQKRRTSAHLPKLLDQR